MREYINDDTVYVRSTKDAVQDSPHDPADFTLSKIDGSCTVKMIIKNIWMTEYKVYESIYKLLQENRIVPLSPHISRSIQAAVEKKERQSYSILPAAFSIIVTAGLILLILFSGFIVFNTIVLSQQHAQSKEFSSELENVQKERKFCSAELLFKALNFKLPESGLIIVNSGLLDKNDLPVKSDKTHF